MRVLSKEQNRFLESVDHMYMKFAECGQDKWIRPDASILVSIKVPQEVKDLLTHTAELIHAHPDSASFSPADMESVLFSNLVFNGLTQWILELQKETTK